MTSTVFVNQSTVIVADWLNDVNTVAYTTVPALSTTVSGLTTTKVDKTASTGSVVTPVGTTAERDAVPQAGYFRYNTTNTSFEGYTGSAWGAVGGGAKGGGPDDVFYENGQAVTTDYTITAGKNAMSAGPITILDGVTVTIPDGCAWVING